MKILITFMVYELIGTLWTSLLLGAALFAMARESGDERFWDIAVDCMIDWSFRYVSLGPVRMSLLCALNTLLWPWVSVKYTKELVSEIEAAMMLRERV